MINGNEGKKGECEKEKEIRTREFKFVFNVLQNRAD